MKNKLVVSAFLLGIIFPSILVFTQSKTTDESYEVAFMLPDKQLENPALNLNNDQKKQI